MEAVRKLFGEAEFWVLIAFVIAMAVVVWKARSALLGMLDRRAEKIKAEIDEAWRLADEAQKTLAQHQLRQRDALKEAETIMAQARDEAERAAQEGHKDLAAALERRKRLAAERLTLEEQKALNEVRATAVDVAIAAVRRVLAEDLDAKHRAALVDQAIAALPETLH
ncbi:MAG: F0F1 ATP synthase subunit B [Alphaproteobacteria bacterium]|nr:F0F1 ATP synthase subunit B [Alphaproteobacteria bacterium]